jgi:hypothetical protein
MYLSNLISLFCLLCILAVDIPNLALTGMVLSYRSHFFKVKAVVCIQSNEPRIGTIAGFVIKDYSLLCTKDLKLIWSWRIYDDSGAP